MKKILLIGLIGLGIYYAPILLAIQRIESRLSRLFIISIQATYIRIGIGVFITNNSNTMLELERVNLELYLNGRFLGYIDNPVVQQISPNTDTEIVVTTDLLYTTIGTEIATMIRNLSGNFTFTVKGKAYVNNRYIPIPELIFTQNDIFYDAYAS